MKKKVLSLISVIVALFFLAGCSVLQTIYGGDLARDILGQGSVYPTPGTGSQNGYYDIDPLGILESSIGEDIHSYTRFLNEEEDYYVYCWDDETEYDFFDKIFYYFGEDIETYYNLYTFADSDDIYCAEYEVYFDSTNPDAFLNHYAGYYSALCYRYGESNIYECSYKGLDDSFEDIVYSDFDTLSSKLYAFENGGYYVCWEGPGYLLFYQVIADDDNVFSDTNKKYYDVFITKQQYPLPADEITGPGMMPNMEI